MTTTTATLEAAFVGMPRELTEQMADGLMEALEAHPRAQGPMIVANVENGETVVSFQFVAVGDPSLDVPHAMDITAEASADTTLTIGPSATLGVLSGWSPHTSVERVELAFA